MFRYRDAHGIEKRLAHEADLRDAIRDGRIKPGTPLAEGETGRWTVASRNATYKAIVRRGNAGGGAGNGVSRLLARLTPAQRRFIPMMLFIALAIVGGHVQRQKHDAIVARKNAYSSAILGYARGKVPPPELLAEAVPAEDEDPLLRQLWVKLHVMEDLRRTIDSLHTAYGITGFDPPEVWLTDPYIRNARSYPRVATHWQNYLRFTRDHGHAMEPVLRRLYSLRAEQAKLSQREFIELIRGEMEGLGSLGWDLSRREDFAEQALLLHEALVSSKGNAYNDRGEWYFTDPSTQRAWTQRIDVLARLAEDIEKSNQQRAERLGVNESQAAQDPTAARLRAPGS